MDDKQREMIVRTIAFIDEHYDVWDSDGEVAAIAMGLRFTFPDEWEAMNQWKRSGEYAKAKRGKKRESTFDAEDDIVVFGE